MRVKIMQEDTKKTRSSLLKSMKLLRELLDEQRLAILYLKFDVEATRRERNYWRKKAENGS